MESTKEKPEAAERKRCAFCGKVGRLSKEHFYPQWMHPEVPMRTGPKASYSIIELSSAGRGAALEEDGRRRKNGDVAHAGMHVVCEPCNNGWMSQIENAVRVPLLRLMRGERCTLSREERSVVSRWIVLKLLVADAFENAAVFNDEQRHAFMADFHVPGSVTVWLGYLDSAVPGRIERLQGTLTSTKEEPPPERDNTASLAFNLGRLSVFVLLDRAHLVNLEGDLAKKLVQLWPLRSHNLPWPPFLLLSVTESKRLGQTVSDMFRSVYNWLERANQRTKGL